MILNGELIYSADQIRVPPELPDILKNYTKFILKNQPNDILAASAEYFSQLSKTGGHGPLNKELSDTQLEAIFLMFQGTTDKAERQAIIQACQKAGVSQQKCDDCLALGQWSGEVNWLQFWALLVASTRTNLPATIDRCAQLISGGLKTVAAQPIYSILDFLALRDSSVDKNSIEAVKKSALEENRYVIFLGIGWWDKLNDYVYSENVLNVEKLSIVLKKHFTK